MPRTSSVELTVHYPETPEGQQELRRRVAGVHAKCVTEYIQALQCPLAQKLKLHDAVAGKQKD